MRNQSLELPRETREESARVELGRHRASPRHDGADDAAQDLSFRHAVIIRPHSKRCRTRGAPMLLYLEDHSVLCGSGHRLGALLLRYRAEQKAAVGDELGA